MKKIIMPCIVLIASAITIYSVAFWEPSNDINSKKSYAEKSGGSNIVKVDEEKEVEVKNEENGKGSEVSNSVSNESISIYKIDKNQIKDNISKKDWEIVNGIIKEMSIVDIERIKNEEENGEDGIKEIFNILNTRLSQKNYKVIESIFDPYIDFSLLEERV